MPKRIIFPAKGQVALEGFEPGLPGAEEISVRSLYSLMSIGTETTILHQKYATDTHFTNMFSFPQLQTGVQTVAQVEEVGSAVTEFSTGDIIFMRMGHCSHQVIAASACSPVPEGIDHQQACWAGLAKTAFRAAWAGRFELGQSLLIIGAGPVGQMAIRWAAAAGVEDVSVVDLSEPRLEYARRGGANRLFNGSLSDCLDEVKALNRGKGPSLVVDVTGNAELFSLALAAVARFGKVILLGDSGYPGKQCLTSDVMMKGLTVQATHDSHDRDGWDQRRVDRLFFDLVKRKKFDLSGLMTHEFSPQECEEAYRLADEQRERLMGVLFNWEETA